MNKNKRPCRRTHRLPPEPEFVELKTGRIAAWPYFLLGAVAGAAAVIIYLGFFA